MLKLEEHRIFKAIGGDIHALNEENSHPPTCLILFEVPKKSARICTSGISCSLAQRMLLYLVVKCCYTHVV